jgi:hypothetical protein
MTVVEMFDGERPSMLSGLLDNVLTCGLDVVQYGRAVGRIRPIDDCFSLRNRCKRTICQPVYEADQKVPGAHGRIANFQVKDEACRIETL